MWRVPPGMARSSSEEKLTPQAELFLRVYGQVPAFRDIFDEETFYLFAAFFVLATCFVAFLLSRFIVLRPVE